MIPIVPTRGNHESAISIYNLFDTPIADAYYAITFGDNMVRSYTLNSEISLVGNQLTWLQNEFQSASSIDARWKMVQYHKPMRPHTAAKSEGDDIYNAWAQLLFDNQVRLVVDCDSHTAKTTYPIKPSMAPGNDEGFMRNDSFGTVYAGEGCWGAPLRSANDNKAWTRNSGAFHQFKLIWVGLDTIEMRTIKIENVAGVAENSNNDPFQIPAGTSVWNPSNGSVVEIYQPGIAAPCFLAGTLCDDANSNTIFDEEDGKCICSGVPFDAVSASFEIASSSDDAEEDQSNNGLMDLVNY